MSVRRVLVALNVAAGFQDALDLRQTPWPICHGEEQIAAEHVVERAY